MKTLKITPYIMLLLITAVPGFAQKQIFDVVSYITPNGWHQEQNEGGIQLSVTDKKTGGYAIAIVTKATTTTATATENFNTDWNRLVKNTVLVNGAPTMQEPSSENGWDILSGNAGFTNGADKGIVTLLTATGNWKMVSVVILTNTQQYQASLLSFLSSLQLAPATDISGNNRPIENKTNHSSLVGLWTNNLLETSGYYNGIPQYSAGYARSEYLFKDDGSYIYRAKNWLVYGPKDILFVYETGNYEVKGDQITLTPNERKGGWWKKTNSTKEWGSFVKETTDRNLEKKPYNFEIKYFSGSDNTALILKTGDKTGVLEYSYTKRALHESLIDNPPGFRTGIENTSPASVTKKEAAATINSPLTGKIWEGTTTEKFPNAGGISYNTGGFVTHQYQFNADGTYRFVNVSASHYADTKSLQYETGTYTISGNQLTVIPVKGSNEEWSKRGITTNGNSDVTNRSINETWGKKLKTGSRKLETITYIFHIESKGGRSALLLEYSQGHTEREGYGNQSYLTETARDISVKLPSGMK